MKCLKNGFVSIVVTSMLFLSCNTTVLANDQDPNIIDEIKINALYQEVLEGQNINNENIEVTKIPDHGYYTDIVQFKEKLPSSSLRAGKAGKSAEATEEYNIIMVANVLLPEQTSSPKSKANYDHSGDKMDDAYVAQIFVGYKCSTTKNGNVDGITLTGASVKVVLRDTTWSTRNLSMTYGLCGNELYNGTYKSYSNSYSVPKPVSGQLYSQSVNTGFYIKSKLSFTSIIGNSGKVELYRGSGSYWLTFDLQDYTQNLL